jgi:hypothetical protein
MGNDERPKMSWREIDKARDGSSSRGSSSGRSGGGPRSGGDRGGDPHQKQYRAALEAAFAKGELGKLADKLNLLGRSSNEESRPSLASLTAAAPAAPPDKPSLSERAVATSERASGEAAAGAAGSVGDEGADGEAKKKAAAKKKPGEDKPTLHRKLLEAPSRHEISKAAEKYLARFPMPDDHEFLEQLLEHEQDARIKEAMLRITQLLDRRLMPRRTRALIGKLRYLTETNADEEIRDKAQALLQRLG